MQTSYRVRFLDELRAIPLFWSLIKKLTIVELQGQYKGSLIGPMWACLSFVIKLFVLTLVYSKVMASSISEYLPYLACGILTWQYISGLVMDSGVFFQKNRHYLLQFRRPFSIFISVSILKNAVLFGVNLIMVLPLIFYFSGFSYVGIAGFFLGFFLLSIIGGVFYYISGVVCLLKPDVRHLMQSVMTIGFVVTPVLWSSKALEGSMVLDFNPFYHFLSVVRDPLLHHSIPMDSLLVTFGFLFAFSLIALFILRVFGRKVLLWL